MSIWLTSDTHYGHINILKYCDRPFENVDQMNQAMWATWHATVNPNDYVVHVGDVTLISKPEKNLEVAKAISNLPGKVVLLRGNHDTRAMVQTYVAAGWHVLKTMTFANVMIQHWPGALDDDKSLMIHGHSHSRAGHARSDSYHVDVGVDAWNYQLVPASAILNDYQISELKLRLDGIFS